MYIAYSSVIDWVVDDVTVSEDVALARLSPDCRQVVRETLVEGDLYKLSFGYSDEDGIYQADFTPRRGHPLARKYEAWIVYGASPLDAIMQAKSLWARCRDSMP